MSNQRQIDYEHLRILAESIQNDMIALGQKVDELVLYISGESDPPDRKYLLLKKIHEEGDAVNKERFEEIGLELGYAIEEMQGFLAWSGGILTRIAGGKIALTERGIEALRKRGLID